MKWKDHKSFISEKLLSDSIWIEDFRYLQYHLCELIFPLIELFWTFHWIIFFVTIKTFLSVFTICGRCQNLYSICTAKISQYRGNTLPSHSKNEGTVKSFIKELLRSNPLMKFNWSSLLLGINIYFFVIYSTGYFTLSSIRKYDFLYCMSEA